MNDIDLNDDYTIESIDFNLIDIDPNEGAKLKYIRERERYRKNIILASEFESKYLCLFNTSLAANKSIDEMQTLSQEYTTRIDPYFPVYVVRCMPSSKVSEILASDNVLYTLPPMYHRLGTVNVLGEEGLNILQAFNNVTALGMDDRFDHKKALYTEHMKLVLNSLEDGNKEEEDKKIARAMAEEAVEQSKVYDNPEYMLPSEQEQELPPDIFEELNIAKEVEEEKQTMEQEEFL